MDQLSFSDAEHQGKRKKTRREIFLEQMERVVPWQRLIAIIEPHYPKSSKAGRPPYSLEKMLRVHCMQNWYGLSDPAMEESLYEIASMRRFARLSLTRGGIPDETTILNFRHLLKRNGLTAKILDQVTGYLHEQGLMLSKGTIVDATIISAPSSTKNKQGQRDPEMHQTKKGNQWFFGMKAHIGVDTHSGLVHSVACAAANEHDLNQAGNLLHGNEEYVFGDAGYRGIEKRKEFQHSETDWFIAEPPGQIRAMKRRGKRAEKTKRQIEKAKAGIRAKVEHPFRIIKCQFGFTKARYKGLMKNGSQLNLLFALANLFQARKRLLAQG